MTKDRLQHTLHSILDEYDTKDILNVDETYKFETVLTFNVWEIFYIIVMSYIVATYDDRIHFRDCSELPINVDDKFDNEIKILYVSPLYEK